MLPFAQSLRRCRILYFEQASRSAWRVYNRTALHMHARCHISPGLLCDSCSTLASPFAAALVLKSNAHSSRDVCEYELKLWWSRVHHAAVAARAHVCENFSALCGTSAAIKVRKVCVRVHRQRCRIFCQPITFEQTQSSESPEPTRSPCRADKVSLDGYRGAIDLPNRNAHISFQCSLTIQRRGIRRA